ncbi:MAG: hypothetical protein KAI66_22660, partial [Lentisphaeria bacterium]|nr:hypothetical protein [Lentisphaeria bacterium]
MPLVFAILSLVGQRSATRPQPTLRNNSYLAKFTIEDRPRCSQFECPAGTPQVHMSFEGGSARKKTAALRREDGCKARSVAQRV